MYGVFHLNDLVSSKVNEILVVCCLYFKLISSYFIFNLFAKMLKNPSNLIDGKIPLHVAQYDEIVYSRIFKLIVITQYFVFYIISQFKKQQILKDANVFFMAIISASLIIIFLLVNVLYLFFESHLLHHFLYLLLFVEVFT